MTKIQQRQIDAMREGETTTLYRRGRDYLVAEEHAQGLHRIIIHPDGSFTQLGSGPVPPGWHKTLF